ncbi:MAG: amidohydrolase family protein [Acetomicrobium sp.]
MYCYTEGGGTVMHDPYIGSLEIGKLADFIVVDEDPFEADAGSLKDIVVLKTYIGGKAS